MTTSASSNLEKSPAQTEPCIRLLIDLSPAKLKNTTLESERDTLSEQLVSECSKNVDIYLNFRIAYKRTPVNSDLFYEFLL